MCAIAPDADVAGDAVADAVRRLEHGAGVRPPPVDAVAEAQRRGAVVLHLDDELGRIAVADPSRSSCGVHGSCAPSSVPSSATAGRAARGSEASVASAAAGRA